MASEIRQYSAAIPAGTTPAGALSTDMSFPARVVDTVEIVVPPGPNGVVGFALLNSGVTVIPYDSDDWIISNNEVIQWPLNGYITSGSWQLRAYNTGTNDHAIYVRFLLSLPNAVASAPLIQPIDATLLAGSVN